MDGHRRHRQKLDKPLKYIIFRPSWQDTSRQQLGITHSTAICYISRSTFQPLPRPPFESTSWHYNNAANIWLPSIYRIHLLSRGSKKKIRSLLKKDAKARTGCCQEGRKTAIIPQLQHITQTKEHSSPSRNWTNQLKHIIFRPSWQDISKP